MVLACAVGGGASIVVSSDKDVLSKNNYGDIRFLSVEAFLEELG
jgi:predicted nucleic acid-binding protein